MPIFVNSFFFLLTEKVFIQIARNFERKCKNTYKSIHQSSKKDSLKIARDMNIYSKNIFTIHAWMIGKKIFQNTIHYCIGQLTEYHQLNISKIEKVI